jgi:hypothetical protein
MVEIKNKYIEVQVDYFGFLLEVGIRIIHYQLLPRCRGATSLFPSSIASRAVRPAGIRYS